jgi:hypothetical protein
MIWMSLLIEALTKEQQKVSLNCLAIGYRLVSDRISDG